MTTKISGSAGIEFPDSTVQATAWAPPGALMDFAMNSAPAGWLAANGALVSRATYSALFAAIGTTWGAGDGSTTFQLPDMRGYFRRGAGTNTDGTASAAFATKQADELKSHTHTYPARADAAAMSHDVSLTNLPGTNSATPNNTGNGINNTGGSETRPKNIAVLTCIKI